MVLIIDDSDLFVRSIQQLFRGVVSASTLGEGIRLAQELQPKAIILEVMIGEENGLLAIPAIRAVSPWSRIYVLTSFVNDISGRIAKNLGACAFLQKDLAICAVEDIRSYASEAISV